MRVKFLGVLYCGGSKILRIKNFGGHNFWRSKSLVGSNRQVTSGCALADTVLVGASQRTLEYSFNVNHVIRLQIYREITLVIHRHLFMICCPIIPHCGIYLNHDNVIIALVLLSNLHSRLTAMPEKTQKNLATSSATSSFPVQLCFSVTLHSI